MTCVLFWQECDMLSFVRSLKNTIRPSNAVAVITFPPSLFSPSFSKRLQHLADTLVSVKAIPGVCLYMCFMSLLLNITPFCGLIIYNLCLKQTRTRNWPSFLQDIRIWLAFSVYTRWHVLIHRLPFQFVVVLLVRLLQIYYFVCDCFFKTNSFQWMNQLNFRSLVKILISS